MRAMIANTIVSTILFALAVLAITVGMGAASSAHADTGDRVQQSVTVRIDRAGVMRGEERAVREARATILRAARRVCGLSGVQRITLRERRDGQDCLRDAVEQTVAYVQSAYLANAFAGLLGPDRLARLEWGTPQTITFAAAPTLDDKLAA